MMGNNSGSKSSQKTDRVAYLTSRLRQSLQVCSMHTVGPLAAYDDCITALHKGEISYAEFQSIAHAFRDTSKGYIEKANEGVDKDASTINIKSSREERMIRFVDALFYGTTETRKNDSPSLSQRPLIGVVGKGRNCPAQTYQLALSVGRLLGRLNPPCIVVTGGLSGSMEAATQGAAEVGGLSIGLLPNQVDQASPQIRNADISINTGVPVHVRNIILASAVDAIVAVPGSHGTLQEMITALDLEKPVWAIGEHTVRLPEARYLASLDELQEHVIETLRSAPDPTKK